MNGKTNKDKEKVKDGGINERKWTWILKKSGVKMAEWIRLAQNSAVHFRLHKMTQFLE
jgi:hypothetical protein